MKTLRRYTLALALALAAAFGAAQAQGLRPEIGKPLQQASDYLKAGKAREALAKVREAEAVPGRSPAEQLTIDRMKAAAAQRAGDFATAIQALESIYPKVGGGEQPPIAEQIASAYVQTRNNAKATEWLGKATASGYSSATTKQLQGYLLASSGDHAAIARDASAAVAAAEQAGRRPEEADLLRLQDAQGRSGNPAGQVATLEKLVTHYPKKDYWGAYLGRLPRKPGFGDRFALDVLRLKLQVGLITKTEEFMELAQLALQAGLPAEGRRIVEQGYKTGALGSGPEAARHQRLRDLATKQEAEARGGLAAQVQAAAGSANGEDLVKAGIASVSLGEVDAGIDLIQKGLAKGGLKRPEDARLRLGLAQQQSARARAAAAQTLRAVKGTDGVAEIARAWLIVGTGG
jgi:hypothetical protein